MEWPENCGTNKMATMAGASRSDAASQVAMTVPELAGRLDLLEKGLFTKLAELINPLTEKIDQLSLSIQNVNSIVEGAMDLSMYSRKK